MNRQLFRLVDNHDKNWVVPLTFQNSDMIKFIKNNTNCVLTVFESIDSAETGNPGKTYRCIDYLLFRNIYIYIIGYPVSNWYLSVLHFHGNRYISRKVNKVIYTVVGCRPILHLIIIDNIVYTI